MFTLLKMYLKKDVLYKTMKSVEHKQELSKLWSSVIWLKWEPFWWF